MSLPNLYFVAFYIKNKNPANLQGHVLLCFGIVLLGVDNAFTHYAMRFNFVSSKPLFML